MAGNEAADSPLGSTQPNHQDRASKEERVEVVWLAVIFGGAADEAPARTPRELVSWVWAMWTRLFSSCDITTVRGQHGMAHLTTATLG